MSDRWGANYYGGATKTMERDLAKIHEFTTWVSGLQGGLRQFRMLLAEYRTLEAENAKLREERDEAQDLARWLAEGLEGLACPRCEQRIGYSRATPCWECDEERNLLDEAKKAGVIGDG